MTDDLQPAELYVDPHHRLSDADFAAVCAKAKEIREEIKASAQGGAASGITPLNDLTELGVRSKKYFGVSGIPTQLLVVHSGECPLSGGYARSLTLWAATVYPQAPVASWQWFQDPLEMVAFIPPELGAWHASEANVMSEGFEQAGYARFSRAEWLTPEGKTQLESLAFYMAQRALANGIPAVWLTNAQVTAATNGDRSIKGLCFHRQIDPETRTDPGNGYPADLLLERIQFYMGGGTSVVSTPEEEDEKMLYVVTEPNGKLWIGDCISRRHIPNMDLYEDYRNVALAGAVKIYKDAEPQVWPPEVLGVDIEGVVRANALTVALNSSDVAALAVSLKETLAPELAAELARRLAA